MDAIKKESDPTDLFNLRLNLGMTLLKKKWLKRWLFEHKTHYLSAFLSKRQKGSEITLPLRKNAIQLNPGRFRAILRYSSGFTNKAHTSSYLFSL